MVTDSYHFVIWSRHLYWNEKVTHILNFTPKTTTDCLSNVFQEMPMGNHLAHQKWSCYMEIATVLVKVINGNILSHLKPSSDKSLTDVQKFL